MSETETDYEQSEDLESTPEVEVPRRHHRGGKGGQHVREEPTSLAYLQVCPLAVTCFRYQSCYEYCERISQIQHHRELVRLFVLHLHNGHVKLAGVDFTLSPEIVAQATGIPNVREEWNKRQKLDRFHYEPYIKPVYMRHLTAVFPFIFLRDEYAPLMKLIIRYFTCEGRSSRLYSYHICLLMHFTRVRMMNIPFFMCRNIERMVPLVQRKSPAQQHKSIYHYALIKIVVMHQLAQQGISWDVFISHDVFTVPQPPPEVVHDEGGPSQQFDIPEPRHFCSSPVVAYQRGHRPLFASTRRVLSPHQVKGVLPSSSTERVLSPHQVEGVSPSSLTERVLSPHQVEGASLSTTTQVPERGKQPTIEEGLSGDPDIDIIDLDIRSPSLELKEIIQQQKAENDSLQHKLEMVKWKITYLEQHNKQLEDEHTLDELRRIHEDRNLARKRPCDLTPIEREAMLLRVNTHLEKLLAKANKEKDML